MWGWFFLAMASFFEIGWIYSLKYLEFKKIKQIPLDRIFQDIAVAKPILPLLGYIVFGLANISLFSRAMKELAPSTAFAVWMAMTLIGVKLIDVLVFHEPFSMKTLLFMLLVVVGIIGLKME